MYKSFVFTLLFTITMLFSLYTIVIVNYKMLFMDSEYPMWLHVSQVMNSHSEEKKQLIVIGDSRSKAGFIPDEITELKSLNLSLGGASPIEGYYILRNYLENNPSPDHIILSYTGYHLMDRSVYWDRTVAYEFLNNEDYDEIEIKAGLLNEKSILRHKKYYLSYYNPFIYRTQFINGILGMRWENNSQFLKECIAAEGHHYFGTKDYSERLNTDTKQKYFKKSMLQDYYLRKLIALAKNQHIKVYFYIMPFNKASYDKVDKAYINNFTHYLDDISKEFKMKLCNKLTYMGNSKFGDSSHLFRGAKANTREMFDCIER